MQLDSPVLKVRKGSLVQKVILVLKVMLVSLDLRGKKDSLVLVVSLVQKVMTVNKEYKDLEVILVQ